MDMADPESQQKKHEQANLASEVKEYVEKRVQLITLNLAEQFSLAIAHSFQRLIGLLLFSGALFFGWFAAGFYLAELTESNPIGFALAALPLFLISFIFMKSKSKKLTEKIQAEIIQSILREEDRDSAGKNGKVG
ncbi:MAG: hypothetical protein EA360_09805 [Balneolaceae bacterium]|nr:MAG: hypothetical protein EA360_09805 [Balneolaceae bacterium]